VYVCFHEAVGALSFRRDVFEGMNLLVALVLDSETTNRRDAET
jgi:hypothetical protein